MPFDQFLQPAEAVATIWDFFPLNYAHPRTPYERLTVVHANTVNNNFA